MAACDGIRVLEVAAGFCAASVSGQLLAGLGAEVIKLDMASPDSAEDAAAASADLAAQRVALLDAGKDRRSLDPEKNARARQWQQLVEWADVVLYEGDSDGLSGLWSGPEALSVRWPEKVICSISCFGNSSTRKGWIGNELIAQAMGGLIACTGYPERPPVRAGVPYATHVTGLFAFDGILAALLERERSGLGQWIDVAYVDCVVALLGNFVPTFFLAGRVPRRVGNRHNTAAPWNIYPTIDRPVMICTGSGGGWWEKITRVIERPDLSEDERYDHGAKRVQRVQEVDEIISAWTSRHAAESVIDRMEEAGIPVSEITSIERLLADPHYRDTRAMVLPAASTAAVSAVPLAVGLPLKVGAWKPSGRPPPAHAYGQQRSAHLSAWPARGLSRSGALAGLRVIEFGARTSVPLAGRVLADLGADVVKIEPPKGEGHRLDGQVIGGSSYLFHINNAGKRSLVVDPNRPGGIELILKLASEADVWLENLAPGTLDAMGLGYDNLSRINARLIYASCSGFGRKSNYGKKRALDAVVQAATGFVHMTGYPDHVPVKIGISAVDLGVAVGLVGAVLGALRERAATGTGMHIDLAMADIGTWMTQSLWPQVAAGQSPARNGNRSSETCPHNVFATAAGSIAIAVDKDEQWEKFVALLGDGALSHDAELKAAAGRLRHVERIEEAIRTWLADKDAELAARLCQAAGVPAAPVRELNQIVSDADLRTRGLVLDKQHRAAGNISLLGNPLHFSRTPAVILSAAPTLGEHTKEVLTQWLALEAQAIEDLCEKEIVVADKLTTGAVA